MDKTELSMKSEVILKTRIKTYSFAKIYFPHCPDKTHKKLRIFPARLMSLITDLAIQLKVSLLVELERL